MVQELTEQEFIDWLKDYLDILTKEKMIHPLIMDYTSVDKIKEKLHYVKKENINEVLQ